MGNKMKMMMMKMMMIIMITKSMMLISRDLKLGQMFMTCDIIVIIISLL